MDSDRQRWEERYSEAPCLHGETPSRFLQDNLAAIVTATAGRRALDIACGEGRNSLFLARQGFAVYGVDIAETALERARNRIGAAGLSAEFQNVDLDTWQPTASYDLIMAINFLHRELFPLLVNHLTPGGVLLVDTIMAGDTLVGNHNPAYLLAPGELLQIFTRFAGTIITSAEFSGSPYPHAAMLFQKSAG
jgi:2-polyprenyl-3-methyl-5-hydroxy-6-metoxy-1,4-benzoquinol methylase